MNSVTPVTRRRRKKRGGKTAVMVILSVFFVLASVGCIFGFLLYFHQKQETAQAMLRMGEMEKLQEALFTQEQLEEALAAQKGSGKKLGEVLVDKNAVNEEQMKKI